MRSSRSSSAVVSGGADTGRLRTDQLPYHKHSRRVAESVEQATMARPGPLTRMAKGTYQVFLELFVHSSLWMAFSLASLVLFVQLSCTGGVGAAVPLSTALHALDYRPFWTGVLESLAVYTLDHVRDGRMHDDDENTRKSGIIRFRLAMLLVLCVSAMMGFLGCLFAARSARVVLSFLAHLALCVGYVKLKPRMPYMKAAYVSLLVVFLAFAAPTAYAPALLSGVGVSALLRMGAVIFCVAFTVENLQDLRDVVEDRKAGVVTLPSGLGRHQAGQLLLAVQVACALLHVLSGALGRLPLRPDMLVVYALCILGSRVFGPKMPRSLFQVALEPLYATPLAALMLGAALGSPL